MHNRLRWQCRRGLLELDVILGNFLDSGYDYLSSTEKALFEELLQESDPELLAWLLNQEKPLNKHYNQLLNKIIVT